MPRGRQKGAFAQPDGCLVAPASIHGQPMESSPINPAKPWRDPIHSILKTTSSTTTAARFLLHMKSESETGSFHPYLDSSSNLLASPDKQTPPSRPVCSLFLILRSPGSSVLSRPPLPPLPTPGARPSPAASVTCSLVDPHPRPVSSTRRLLYPSRPETDRQTQPAAP